MGGRDGGRELGRKGSDRWSRAVTQSVVRRKGGGKKEGRNGGI